MKTNLRVNKLTAEEMIKLYNENEKSFQKCAELMGCTIRGWAQNWHDKKCEDVYDSVSSIAKSFVPICAGRVEVDPSREDYGDTDPCLIKASDLAVDYTQLLTNTTGCYDHRNDTIINEYSVDNLDSLDNMVPVECKCDCGCGQEGRIFDRDVETYSIAVISDLHLGSIYQQLSALNEFTDICKNRDITTLLCVGDLSEGIMSRAGHKNERFLHSIDEIGEYCAEVYPDEFENNIFITGNHDESINKRLDGYDIGKNICRIRRDLTYVPENPSLPDVVTVDGGLRVQLFHGANGCPKARAIRLMNKDIELRAMGQEYALLLGGHCHSSSFIPSYMGTPLVGCASFQALTPYLARKGLVSECGGVILNYQMCEGKLVRLTPEFIFENELGGIRRMDF